MELGQRDKPQNPALVDVCAAFFQKLTDNHPFKEQLNKELEAFKTILNTNTHNTANIDKYLYSLSTKPIIPAQSLNVAAANPDPSAEGRNGSLSTKTNIGSSYDNNNSKSTKSVEIISTEDFLKYRTVKQADKNQILSGRYSHVQSLDKNPNNLYRTIALYFFTLIMKGPVLEKKLTDIVDDVAAKRIQLYCPTENLQHDDLCGSFCGCFSELIRLKRQQAPLIKMLQTFHKMVGSDRFFGTALSSFIKSKIISFIEQKDLPYELFSIKTLVHSPAFKEKIENNDYSHFESIVHILPFALGKRIKLHLFESGKLTEMTYNAPKSNDKSEVESLINENYDLSTMFLLVEKSYQTVLAFGLFPSTSSPFNSDKGSVPRPLSVNTISDRNSVNKTGLVEPDAQRKKAYTRALTINTSINEIAKGQSYQFGNNTLQTGKPMQQEIEQKHKPTVSRLSYNPTPATTHHVAYSSKLGQGRDEEKSGLSSERDASKIKETLLNGSQQRYSYATTSRYATPKRNTASYEPGYLTSMNRITTEPGSKTIIANPNNDVSIERVNPMKRFGSETYIENEKRANHATLANKPYQFSHLPAKRISLGSHLKNNEQSAVLSPDSGRDSTNYPASEDSATPYSKRIKSPVESPIKVESPIQTEPCTTYYKSSFGGKYSSSTLGNAIKTTNVMLFNLFNINVNSLLFRIALL